MEGLRVMRGKKARLSKKMQNILLLNSENSIPVSYTSRILKQFGGVPVSNPHGRGEGGSRILYNYRKGAIRVVGEISTKNEYNA